MDDLDKLMALLFFFVAVYGSLQKVWGDPYYHKEKVDFWTWFSREVDEFLHGERE